MYAEASPGVTIKKHFKIYENLLCYNLSNITRLKVTYREVLMRKYNLLLIVIAAFYMVSCANRHIPTGADVPGTASFNAAICTPGTINYTQFSYSYMASSTTAGTAGAVIIIKFTG